MEQHSCAIHTARIDRPLIFGEAVKTAAPLPELQGAAGAAVSHRHRNG